MKVFKFDVSRSAKGDFIEDIARPHSTGGIVEGKITPPRHNTATHSWRVIGEAGHATLWRSVSLALKATKPQSITN